MFKKLFGKKLADFRNDPGSMTLKYAMLLLLGLLMVTGCQPSMDTNPNQDPDEIISLRLPMGYIPDPQYAPYYVAAEKGYFADEGFEVQFDYSFETDGVALVGANELPFAIVAGDQVILARAQDLPIVYVMEWFQRYPIAVVSKTEAGIRDAQDLAGKTVGLPGFFGASYVGFAGLLSANDLTLDDVDAIDVGFNQVETLLSDQAEAVVVFANNEPLQLADAGQDVQVIQVADYIDLVSNGIITNEETIENNPQMVQRFVRAVLRGLRDTLADPDQAYEISKNYVEGLDDSRKSVLEASLDLWDAQALGRTDGPSWQRTQEILLQTGLLDSPLEDLDAVYSNEFVEAAQP